jgi:hypothetical protein
MSTDPRQGLGDRIEFKGVGLMARRFHTTCRECGEPILMVMYRGGWKALDYPDRSVLGEWSNHIHRGTKEWIESHIGNNLGGTF